MSVSHERHRILVVDDNPAIHEDFRKIFCTGGSQESMVEQTAALLFDETPSSGDALTERIEIVSAFQGKEGLEKIHEAAAEQHPYVLAFVDVRMPPGWDGLETTVRIWEAFPDQQVVLCTAFSDYTWEELSRRLGHSDRLFVLKKPFDVAEVRQLAVASIRRIQAERKMLEADEATRQFADAQVKALKDASTMMDALKESEARIRAIVDTAGEGIIVTDQRGLIESFNPAAAEMFGCRALEATGSNIRTLLSQRQHEHHSTESSGGNDNWPLDFNADVGHRRDGTQFPILLSVSEVRLRDRRLFTWMIRDITEHKRTEEQLALFRRFAEASGQGFGMADLDGRIVYTNPTLLGLLGEDSPEDALGKTFASYYPEELREKLEKEVIPAVMQDGQWAGELALLTKRGETIPTLENFFLVCDERGDPLYLSDVISDISAQKQAEEELKRYNYALESANKALEEFCDAAEAANRMKSEFLANMSHELRTPLHGVLSFAAFGVKKIETAGREDLLRYFQKIDQSGQVLLTLVNDLLDLAKLEAKKTDFDLIRVDLPTLAMAVVDEFSSTASERNIRIECRRPDFDGSVIGDLNKLMQVVRNLLSNAVKFSPDGSTIEIVIEREERSMRVSVSDQGIGIPEDELKTVFDKFVQSSKTRTGAGGTGLGLSICREIISAHKGRIRARNRPGGGAVLSFRIPLNVHEDEPLTKHEEAGTPLLTTISDAVVEPEYEQANLDCR